MKRWRKAFVMAPALVMTLFGAAYAQSMTVTLLGTGDPTPRMDRFGPSTLIEAGDKTLLIDAGRGVMQRLYALDVSTGDIDAIFLTHLHSDHIVGLADLLMTGWVINRRDEPLKVYGPVGARAMIDAMREAFQFDIEIRANEARRNPRGVEVEVVEFNDEFEWNEAGVQVTGFLVDHQPVEPAYGFRLDYEGLSVAFSGDTSVSETLIEKARGVDLLIHEVADAPEQFKRKHPHLPRLAHHTQAEDAGRVFAEIAPKLAVYSHIVLAGGLKAEALAPLTRKTYDGPVLLGEDLMVFEITENNVELIAGED